MPEDTDSEGRVRVVWGGPLVAVRRRSPLHRAYLEVLLEREVGSTYSALEEGGVRGSEHEALGGGYARDRL